MVYEKDADRLMKEFGVEIQLFSLDGTTGYRKDVAEGSAMTKFYIMPLCDAGEQLSPARSKRSSWRRLRSRTALDVGLGGACGATGRRKSGQGVV